MITRRLDLDFSGRPARPPRIGLGLLATGVILSLLVSAQLADALAARASYGESLAELDAASARGRQKAAPAGPPDARMQARGSATKQVAKSLQSPWADLLDAIEARPDGKVALLAVEPSAIKRTVRITAEARDTQAMLEHLSQLQKDGRLSDVVLVSHQRQTQAPGSPWRYQIQGSW